APNWRHRLARSMSFPGRRAAGRFVDQVCRPAFQEVAQELRQQGAEAEVVEGVVEDIGVPHVGLRVPIGTSDEFVYEVWPVERPTPAFAPRSVTTHDTYVRFEVRLAEGNQDYDVMGYTKEQLIADALDQYERHLEFLRVRHEASRSGFPDHRPDAPDAHLPEEEERAQPRPGPGPWRPSDRRHDEPCADPALRTPRPGGGRTEGPPPRGAVPGERDPGRRTPRAAPRKRSPCPRRSVGRGRGTPRGRGTTTAWTWCGTCPRTSPASPQPSPPGSRRAAAAAPASGCRPG